MPNSSASRGNEFNSPSVLRGYRRRNIETNDNNSGVRRNHETSTTSNASWTSLQGTASVGMIPPATGTSSTDRLYPVRSARDQAHRYAEDEGDTDGWAPDGRRLYHRKHEEADRRQGRATMAPHSSGVLHPPWKIGRGAEPRNTGSNDMARAEFPAGRRWSTTRQGGGDTRLYSERRAEFSHDERRQHFGSRQEVEWDPYPDEFDDFDDEEENPGRRKGRGSNLDKAHKNKNDKYPSRRATKSRRARAV